LKDQIILALGTIALIIFFYTIYEHDSSNNFNNRESQSTLDINAVEKTEKAQVQNTTEETNSPHQTYSNEENSNNYDYLQTLTKVSELEKQLIKLGYFVPPDYVALYDSYTEETLLQMADQGDMVAISALKNKYSNSEQWKLFRNLQEKAVMHGSISDISDLHISELSMYSGLDSREKLIKSAAYAELAGLRGSKVTVYYAIENFNQNNIKFTESELSTINDMAKEMLDKINIARQNNGKNVLEKIDDSRLINEAPNNSLSGWGQNFIASNHD